MLDTITRIRDCMLAAAALVLAAPLLLVLALVIRVSLGAPVFFRQQRIGQHGRAFRILKFRTMLHGTDAQGRPLPDSQRMTRLGQLLRATSLDELPELWNVLTGDMALVGPRPLLPEYLPLYSARQARRHEVRPGITGWAQVNGRNALSWETRFEHDVWYVDNRSWLLDLRVGLRTVARVIARDGIAHEGHVTMEPFRGTR